ncbi:MAG: helix-turn-helix domain-containing protein [Verrucomicrobiota bacterium]
MMGGTMTGSTATTQCDQILAWMMEGKPITPRDALIEFGCARLSARIFDLKEADNEIERRLVEVNTRGGTGRARVAQYFMPAYWQPTEQIDHEKGDGARR